MPIRPFEQHAPRIHPSAHIDDSAVVIGDVEIGEDSSVWPLCVIRGDIQRIRIRARSSIQDGTIIHVTHDSRFCPGGQPTLIGNDVTVGHKAILHACTIEDFCLIGMGAIVMDRAVVHSRVTIGAGSVVPRGCTLHPGVVLYEDVQLGEGCEIHANAVLHPGSHLGAGCVVQSNAVIGAEGFGFVPTAAGWVKMPQTGRVVLEDGVEVGCGSTIDRPSVGETRIGAGTKIDNLVHVGHGVVTGRGCALAAQVGIAGGAVLGNGVILAGQVGVANKAVIGDRAIASSKSGIHGEVAAGEVVSGYPAIPNRLWLRCSAAFNKLPEMARTLRRLSSDGG